MGLGYDGCFKTWLILVLAIAVPSCCWASASLVQRAVFQAVWQEINANYYDTDFGGRLGGHRGALQQAAVGDRGPTAFDEMMTEMLHELGFALFSSLAGF